MAIAINVFNSKKFTTICLIGWLCGATFFSGPLSANPQNGVVVAGSANITNNANVTEINQSTDKAIINWNSFSIGAIEETRFIQPSSSSITLNRVVGNVPSNILGRLTANGQLMLVNPAGIIFGAGSKIDVAGLIATTARINDSDFLAGNYRFVQDNNLPTAIINNGEISVAERGLVALVAPGVENNGIIRANLGRVVLASGNNFTIDLYGDQLIQFDAGSEIQQAPVDATGRVLKSAVANNGAIYADGGKVLLTAKTAENIVDNAISMGGVIQATTASVQNGEIILSGDNGIVKVSGTINASGKAAGQKGGKVKVLAKQVELQPTAIIDVSGDSGGGEILVGGNFQGAGPEPNAKTTIITQGALLNASALKQGDGGRIIVWADDYTYFAGDLSARGGDAGGDGGFAEVSGKNYLDFIGNVDLKAPLGTVGELLLDPGDLTISTGSDSNVTTSGSPTNTFTGGTGASVLNTTTLNNALANASVTVQTGTTGAGNGDIFVNNSFSWTNTNSLTLKAYRNITLASGVSITNLFGGNVTLRADSTGTGVGTITGTGTVNLSSGGGQLKIYYNPSSYSSPTNFTSNTVGGTAFIAYMLVNNATQLNSIATTGTPASIWNQNFALGADIDASGIANFTPIGNSTTQFTGRFDGNNQVIQNLTINQSASSSSVGMFGHTSGATITNLGLTNANVTGSTTASTSAGILIGNASTTTVSGSYSTGTITNGRTGLGGLIGSMTGGTLSSSYSSATVTGNAATRVGGLVGISTGAISSSYSTGSVSNNTSSVNVGGLLGQNDTSGTVTNSYSTATVTNTGASSNVGGLVGFNRLSATITGSYSASPSTSATVVNNATTSNVGGLVGRNDATVTKSYSTSVISNSGNITGGGTGTLGGLVGLNTSGVDNSYTNYRN